MTTAHFPAPYVLESRGQHKHTIVALHGLGSTGTVFADRLLFGTSYSEIPNPDPSKHVSQKLATWVRRLPIGSIKFVFPTAPVRSVKFPQPREVPAWFRISSIDDLEFEQDEQQAGLRESVQYLSDIVKSETEILMKNKSSSRDLFVLGRSQGSSVIGWSLMTGRLPEVGGVVLAGSWLIYARALSAAIRERTGHHVRDVRRVPEGAMQFARSMFVEQSGQELLTKLPVLMSHSINDQWISVEAGRQYRDVLADAGFHPDWREYIGADEEGHWFKEPEELNALAEFLVHRMGKTWQ